ncbi:MAG: SAM-dependent methyltransferase [Elainellaceae cyanobacterium]
MVKLSHVVPFGRSLAEYRLMFNLTDLDLSRQILDAGGGPASFNAEMHRLGNCVVSIDPIYQFSGAEIEQRFYACASDIIRQVKDTPDAWVWGYHQSPDDLLNHRETALRLFLTDYGQGKTEGRYLVGELPDLPLSDRPYDLMLCSHLLFLYSDHLSLEMHCRSIAALMARGQELRIFPLLTLDRVRSPHLDPVCDFLTDLGYRAEIIPVKYELQKGGNEMLRVTRRALAV